MPQREWVNARGETVRVLATEKPFKFRVGVDHQPWNPNTMVDRMKERV